MNRTCFVFPGVGSQHTGMGKDLYAYPVFREVIQEACDVLGRDIYKVWQNKEKASEIDELNFAQVSLLTISYASYRLIQSEVGLTSDHLIGHSLGEYSALCCNNVIDFSQGLQLVQERGKCIKEAAASIKGTMLWVINIDTSVVEVTCEALREEGVPVFISAYDTRVQCSISCLDKDVLTIASALEDKGALVYPLKLSGPFHSPLMEPASKAYASVLEGYRFRTEDIRVVSNETALPYTKDVSTHLAQQLISPVRWFQSLEWLESRGISKIVEIGPKEVLKFLIGKGEKQFDCYSLNKAKHLNEIKSELVITAEEYLYKISACKGVAVATRNYNVKAHNYQEEVISPYESIEQLEATIEQGDIEATEAQLKMALTFLDRILEGKKVPAPIRMTSLEHLLPGKFKHLTVR